MRLLWEPLPASWPQATPKRPRGLRGLIAWAREAAAAVPQRDDVEGRVRRAMMQAVLREVYQQTLAEQDSEHRKPAEFAEAWKNRLAALLERQTLQVPGWGEITVANLDIGLGWELYAAASRARTEAIARAVATPSRLQGTDDTPTLSWSSRSLSAEVTHLGASGTGSVSTAASVSSRRSASRPSGSSAGSAPLPYARWRSVTQD